MSGPAGNDAIATTAEYALLAGVSIVIFLAIGTVADMSSSTIEDDAIAIAAYRTAMMICTSICDVTGPGDISVTREIDLPELICGTPYIAYPSPDGHEIRVSVSGHTYRAPVLLRADSVRITGFIASMPAEHFVEFDTATGTVIIS